MADAAQMSDEEQQKRRRAVADLMPKTPFLAGLGIVFDRYEPDDVVIRLPFRADLTNDGTYYHGGVVASVIDTAGAAAAWSNHDFIKGMRASTISMSVQYVGACKKSDLLCHAHTVRRGKELTFTESPLPTPTARWLPTQCRPTESCSSAGQERHLPGDRADLDGGPDGREGHGLGSTDDSGRSSSRAVTAA